MSYFSRLNELKQKNEDLAQKATEMAKAKGADEVKVTVFAAKGVDITATHGDIDLVEFNQDQSMTIYVYKEHRSGAATTSDLSDQSIAEAIEAALAISDYTSPDEFSGLCDLDVMYKSQENDRKLETIFECIEDPDEIARQVLELERQGTALVQKEPLLKATDECGYETAYTIDTIATSHGFLDSSVFSRNEKYIMFVGEHNNVMQRASGYTFHADPNKMWTNEEIIKEACERTLGKLDARKLPTGVYPVILSHDVTGSIISHFKNAIAGSALYRKCSFMTDTLGKQVFPNFLQIRENPWDDRFAGACLFDADCVASRPMDLVKDGVLQEYLLGTYSARKMGMKCNGHNGSGYPVFVTADEAHTRSFEDLLKEVGKGLVINSLIGQGVSIVSGNYSRGAAGYYFEDGVRQYAVDEVTVASNLKDMFTSIALVGNDYDPRVRTQVGSLFIPDMTISGD